MVAVTLQTGCTCSTFPAEAYIFVRKTLRVRLRDRVGGEPPTQARGKDLRFSMKMMLAPDLGSDATVCLNRYAADMDRYAVTITANILIILKLVD